MSQDVPLRSPAAAVDSTSMQGYDLDDTLARVDFGSGRPLVQMFTDAPVIYVPSVDFVVVTGRAHTPPERAATSAWLKQHEPHCRGIHYVQSGTAAVTAQNKAAIINRLHLSDYTDNNANVLAELASLTKAKLWLMQGGKRIPHVDRAALALRWAPTLPHALE